ncbi:MAG TPA: hypothetical protein VKB62_10690 [Streptosporangiaceae bacterium]|nr:hypothetical protein [Streptosporangiaceae bacterium]
MTDIVRHCPDCGSEHSLGQHHGIVGRCPDTADLYCPEWYCEQCGAALLIGDVPAGRGLVSASAGLPAVRDRAAARDRVGVRDRVA